MGYYDKHRISARQAWHDCYYIPKKDALTRLGADGRRRAANDIPLAKAVGVEKIKGQFYERVFIDVEVNGHNRRQVSDLLPLMSGKDGRPVVRDFYATWDPFWRSRVHGAIRSMPRHLRHFGMIMYAPAAEVRSGFVESVQQAVKEALYEYVGVEKVATWRARKILRLNLLVFAALRRYRDCVFGGGPTLGGAKAIDNYLYQMFGERLDLGKDGFSINDHWARDWLPYWDHMITILDELERNALAKVTAVLYEGKANP